MTPRPFQEQKVAKLSEARKPHLTINKKSPTETSVELFIVSNPGRNRRGRLRAFRLITPDASAGCGSVGVNNLRYLNKAV